MRYLIVFLFFTTSTLATYANQKAVNHPLVLSDSGNQEILVSEKNKKEKKMDWKDPKTLSKIAFASSLLGVLLIAVPFLSLAGLLLGLGGFVLGWMMRKKVKKNRWAKWAIALGGLCLLFFLATLALVLFF